MEYMYADPNYDETAANDGSARKHREYDEEDAYDQFNCFAADESSRLLDGSNRYDNMASGFDWQQEMQEKRQKAWQQHLNTEKLYSPRDRPFANGVNIFKKRDGSIVTTESYAHQLQQEIRERKVLKGERKIVGYLKPQGPPLALFSSRSFTKVIESLLYHL
jgi:hypothetical protein